MIEEMGLVVATEPGFAWVETKVKTTCNSCASNDNCGTGLVAKAFTPKPEHIKLATPSPLAIGQVVKIGIPEQSLVQASALLYLVPILSLMISAGSLQYLSERMNVLNEPLIILISFFITFLTYWGISRHLKSAKHQSRFNPVFMGATTQASVTSQQEIPVKKYYR